MAYVRFVERLPNCLAAWLDCLNEDLIIDDILLSFLVCVGCFDLEIMLLRVQWFKMGFNK